MVRQYFNRSEEKAIRIIEFSEKRCDGVDWSESLLAKGDIGVNGNELIFEEEKNYFDDVLKEENLHLKMNP